MGTIFGTVISSVKNWWWFIIKGLLMFVAGAAIFARPAEGYVSLSILFSVVIIAVGFTQIFFAVGNSGVLKGWGWTLASGIIDVLIGGYLISFPVVTMATLPFILGFWLMFRSFYLIGASIDLQSLNVPGWGWLLVGGILLVILSLVILYYPAAGAISIIAYSGSAFIVGGIFNVVLAFKLKGIKKDVKEVEGKIKHATAH